MSEDWCREKLANLQIDDLRLDTLTEIKSCLEKLSANEVALTSNFLQLPALFACVEDSVTEQTTLACDILSICMSNLDLSQTVNNHSKLLERSLNHENVGVKMLAMDELDRVSKECPSAVNDINLIIALIENLKCEETKIGNALIDLLSKLLPKFITNASIKRMLEETLKCRDIVRCRVYEIGTNIAKASAKQLENVEFIMDKMLCDLNNDDVLVQLNVLELFSQVALKEHGLVYLENKGVFANIMKKIETIDQNNLMTKILIPGLMKFFGNIASIYPLKVFSGYPTILSALFDCILSKDPSLLPTAFDTLGHLGSTVEGKTYLDVTCSEKLTLTLTEIGSFIHNLPTELKIRGLDCLKVLFSCNSDQIDNKISTLTQKWYETLSASTDLCFIMKFCKNPFPDIKTASLGFLHSICLYRWGQLAVWETGGFLEYLLDRKIEFDKNAIHEKYDVIKLLSEANLFDNTMQLELQKYVRDGAFYVQPIMEVAIESAN